MTEADFQPQRIARLAQSVEHTPAAAASSQSDPGQVRGVAFISLVAFGHGSPSLEHLGTTCAASAGLKKGLPCLSRYGSAPTKALCKHRHTGD